MKHFAKKVSDADEAQEGALTPQDTSDVSDGEPVISSDADVEDEQAEKTDDAVQQVEEVDDAGEQVEAAPEPPESPETDMTVAAPMADLVVDAADADMTVAAPMEDLVGEAEPEMTVAAPMAELMSDAGAAPAEPEVAQPLPVIQSPLPAQNAAPEPRKSLLASMLPTIERGEKVTEAVPPAMPALDALASTRTEEKPRRGCLTVLLALMVLAVAAYLAGVVAFMQVFMPNTTVNGDDVSLKTIADVAQMHADSVGEVSFAVTGDGVDLQLDAASLKAHYDGGAFARTAIAQQHPWAWPLEVADTHQIEVEKHLLYDAARLGDAVNSAIDAVNKDAKEPVDAKIAFDKKTKRYKVSAEVPGTKIDKTEALKVVRAAFDAGEPQAELGEDLLIKPKVTKDDKTLNDAVNKVNACFDATQEVVTHDLTVGTVGEEELQKWVKFNKDDLSVTFDEDACTKWARGDLSIKLDTIGASRTFNLPDGRQVSVSGGTYGWCINGADIAERIAENVKAGKAGQVEATFLYEGGVWNPGGNDWGDTYVLIDLGAQHVTYYKDGKSVWDSPCVSGGMNQGKMHNTPTGVYTITDYMTSGDVELRGEIDPKTNEPEYISHVKYWMPFIGNSVALHDADWRSEDAFGGTIYQSNGSHGCVNLPPSKAAALYDMVHVGTVVVVIG